MSRNASRLSQAFIARLVAEPALGDVFHWDSSLPGFGLRVFASGRISWVVQYRMSDRRQRRLSIGDVRRLSLAEAKAKARELLSQVALGHDPQGDRHKVRQASRVIDLVDAYLEDAKTRRKRRTFIEMERSLRKTAALLHHLRAEKVERRDVVGLLNRVKVDSGPFAANRVRAYLSAMWNWGIKSGLVDGGNPVAATPSPAVEKSRDRVLSNEELGLIWRCTSDGSQYSRIVRLLLLTAQRRDEIGSMRWDELGGDILLLSADRTKNGRSHEVPMSDSALRQLPAKGGALVFGRSGKGFSAWSLSKTRLDVRIRQQATRDFEEWHGRSAEEGEVQLQPWRLHDLRRTFATWANEAGIEPHVVEAVLNHVSGAAKSGVAGVYNRATYRLQKQQALNRWAAFVADLAP